MRGDSQKSSVICLPYPPSVSRYNDSGGDLDNWYSKNSGYSEEHFEDLELYLRE